MLNNCIRQSVPGFRCDLDDFNILALFDLLDEICAPQCDGADDNIRAVQGCLCRFDKFWREALHLADLIENDDMIFYGRNRWNGDFFNVFQADAIPAYMIFGGDVLMGQVAFLAIESVHEEAHAFAFDAFFFSIKSIGRNGKSLNDFFDDRRLS